MYMVFPPPFPADPYLWIQIHAVKQDYLCRY